MNFVVFVILISVIILKDAASYYSSYQSKGEIQPNHYQKHKKTNTGIFYNEGRNSKHQYKHKKRCNTEEGCDKRNLVYPYGTLRDPNQLQRNEHIKKDDSKKSKSRELVEWINKEMEHVKIQDAIKHREPKVFEIEVESLSGRKERSGRRTIAYEQVNQPVTKQKKFKIIYKRVESNQQVSSEISEGENANGSEQRATDSEKAVAKIEYVTKPPHRRFATVPSYTEFGPEVAYTPSIYVHVKKRNKANLQRSNVQPVSAELKDNSAYGDSVDIDLLDTINNKRTRKKGNENELKFIQHRQAARQQKEIYINSQNEEISAVSNENVKQNDRLEVDHHQLKIYINNDEIHKLSGMKPQEIHKKLSMTFDNEWDEKQNTQAHNLTPAIDGKSMYVKMGDNLNEKSNTDTQSSIRNKEISSKVQSVERSNNQQTISKPEQQDGSEVITLLKPLLVEVLDELKDVKQNTNDEKINNKMQSMQRVVSEKIELIKPTLLEVLNELKENKKLMKQEAQAPQSSPVDIIKPILVGVLDELKESNKKTQEALKEMKKDKKQLLRKVKHSIQEKFPKNLMYPKQKESSDQVEYESTKEDNVNTVESDKSDMSQEESQKDSKSSKVSKKIKLQENELKKKYFKDKKTTDHVYNKHSTNESKYKQTSKCDKLNCKKRPETNILPSNIFNASEILSNPIKQQMVKDVIKLIAKQKLVSMISELLADRFIDKLRNERSRNGNQRMYRSVTNFLKTENATDVFNVVNVETTTDLPVTVQRFEIFLG